MGGKLDFSSQYNVGSTFVFSMQMESCGEELLSIPKTESQSGRQAEDSPRFANVMNNILTDEIKDEEKIEFNFA